MYVLGLLSSSSLLINDYKLEDSPFSFPPSFPLFLLYFETGQGLYRSSTYPILWYIYDLAQMNIG